MNWDLTNPATKSRENENKASKIKKYKEMTRRVIKTKNILKTTIRNSIKYIENNNKKLNIRLDETKYLRLS